MPQEPVSIATGSLVSEAIEGTSVVFCVPPDQLVVSEDKLENVLMKYKENLTSRERWIAPFGIGVTLLLTFATSTFKDMFSVSAATWRSLFLLAMFFDIIWLAKTILLLFKKDLSIQEVVASLKVGGRTKSMVPVMNSAELQNSVPSAGAGNGIVILNSAPQCMRCGLNLPAGVPGGQIICPQCRTLN